MTPPAFGRHATAGGMDRFLIRISNSQKRSSGDDGLDIGAHSRSASAPEVFQIRYPRKAERAQGKPGARSTRGRCALVVSTGSSPRVFRKSPGFPRAMVLTVSFVRDEFLLSPSSRGLTVLLVPVGARQTSADLTSATDARTTRLRRTQRPHQTLRPAVCGLPKSWRSVEAPFVRALVDRSQIRRPALRFRLRARRCRVHRIPPRVS